MTDNNKYRTVFNSDKSVGESVGRFFKDKAHNIVCPRNGAIEPHHLQFFLQMISASIICSVGFATNSETTVIGSMLISPIGALIIDIGKGDALGGGKGGARTLVLKLIEMALIPFLSGLLVGWLVVTQDGDDDVAKGRGQSFVKNKQLFFGTTIVAIAAGLLFAWDKGTPGIGIGIATALLPPIVATGFALGRAMQTSEGVGGSNFTAADAGYSFSVFLINFGTLLGSTYGFTKLNKSICGLSQKYSLSSSSTQEMVQNKLNYEADVRQHLTAAASISGGGEQTNTIDNIKDIVMEVLQKHNIL